jgi:hypothetical protein
MASLALRYGLAGLDNPTRCITLEEQRPGVTESLPG